jgi:diketogulonate reductase-like aldo/keto reductase
MDNRVFGPTQTPVPLIGQGTWQMERSDRAACVKALQRGIDLGMTHIDTAELYGAGRVEELVAEAIEGRRGEIFLASKVKPQNASRAKTIEACERSLRRLKTDRLDLYMLHWQGQHPLQETIAGFEVLREQGKILAYGVSNFDVPALREFISLAGKERLACNQVLYHLEDRGIEHAVLPFCEAHQIAVVAYSPFYVGRFPPEGAGGQVLQELAARHKVSAHQVALQFLLRHQSVFVIPKTTSLTHAEDNAAAASLRLSEDEIAQLDSAFPLGVDNGLPTI